jgi:succinyl-CoA synthetase beta subunit
MGIRNYIQDNPVKIPVIVRMVGNKEEIGHNVLREIGIDPFTDLEKAIDQVVSL